MILRGRGFKAKLKKTATVFIKSLFPVGSIYNAPGKTITTGELLADSKNNGWAEIISVYPEQDRQETAPEIFNYHVTGRFKKYYQRRIPAAYVVRLSKEWYTGLKPTSLLHHP